MVLNESFLECLARKPIAKITVKEICEGADINRSTYYSYFTDPFDQLDKIKSEILVDMTAYVDDIIRPASMDREVQKRLLAHILDYIKSKQHVFGILLTCSGDYNFQHELLSFFVERIFPEGERFQGTETIDQYKYAYAGTGSLGMIVKWIQQGCQTGVEAMAEMIASFSDGLRTTRGEDPALVEAIV